jgi:hypothetical protein
LKQGCGDQDFAASIAVMCNFQWLLLFDTGRFRGFAPEVDGNRMVARNTAGCVWAGPQKHDVRNKNEFIGLLLSNSRQRRQLEVLTGQVFSHRVRVFAVSVVLGLDL